MAGASVVIPVRDAEATLGRCLRSVLAQLPPDGEAIVADDGSADGSAAVASSFAASDARVKVLRLPRRGVSAARNAALAAATGEYLFFADADDEVLPGWIDLQILAMKEKGADFCICGMSFASPTGTGERPDWLPRKEYPLSSGREILESFIPRVAGYSVADVERWNRGGGLFDGRELAFVSRCAFRLDVVRANSIGFDEDVRLGEDALFIVRYLLRARSMVSLARPLYMMHLSSGSSTHRVERDAAGCVRNKIAVLAAKRRLDIAAGGALEKFFAPGCALSALEILSSAARFRLSPWKAARLLREYMSDDAARRGLRAFPRSWRHPLAAIAVTALRLAFPPAADARSSARPIA